MIEEGWDTNMMKNILVVDDDISTLGIFRTLCANVNTQFIGLQNFRQLQIYVNMKVPLDIDIVFIDIKLPIHDGYQVLDWITNYALFPDALFIAISANHDELEKAQSAGFHGFIGKPFKINNLSDIMTGTALWVI